MNSFDLAVVGGGPGGYTAALHAAKSGKKVALIEAKVVGGTCLNEGCIPTKALLASARLLNEINHKAKLLGINVAEADLDYPKVIARKDRIVTRLVTGLQNLFQKHGIQVIPGQAKLQANKQLKIGTDIIQYNKLIWATGSVAKSLAGIKLSKNVLTSKEALQVSSKPNSLLIIGAGVIGLEFATFFSLAGTKVCVVEMLPEILPGIDPEASQLVKASLEKKGVKFILGTTVKTVEEKGVLVEVTLADGEKIAVEKVLNAVGREANLSGLEESGIRLKGKCVEVNENLATSLADVYAVGDVTGISWLAHVAAYQGKVAAENAFGGKVSATYSAIPACIFSLPEIAVVGKPTNSQGDYLVKKSLFNVLGKMQAEGENEGFIKMLINNQTKKIEGLTLVGAHVSELLGEGILSIQFGMTEEDLSKVIRPHPTLQEIYSEILLETHQ
ncbi:MAG: dihydrolipoyl dehydrogenase [Candidatus Margulisbacteria bacterium]|nr:dihydrolipoyl dehydrogenase [Candidatus Margulisiibacteriota bacterium]